MVKLMRAWREIYSQKTRFLGMLFCFCLYIGVTQLSRSIFYVAHTAPVVVLSSVGIGLAGLILFEYAFLPLFVLAVFINGLVNVHFGTMTFPIVLLSIIANVGQAMMGWYILRMVRFEAHIVRLRNTLGLILVALITTPVAPGVISIARRFSGIPQPTPWVFMWMGGVLSVLILTPLLVRLWNISNGQRAKIYRQRGETFILLTLLTGINFVIFWTRYASLFGVSLLILQLGVLVWIALRMGMVRTTLALTSTTLIGLTGPYFGTVKYIGAALVEKVVGIEVYLIIFAILFYVITVISEERDTAVATLEKNVSDLQEALQTIQVEDQRKNEFIATLAHELRNPLASIVSHLDTMMFQGVYTTEYQEPVAGIGYQVRNIKRLLEDLLDISRITQEKVRLRRERVDVRTAIRNAIESTRVMIMEKKHNLSIEVPEEPMWAFADPVRIEQVIVNLIQNAVKYTQSEGNIWVSCSFVDDDISITVRDNGIGIASDQMPVIFDMFTQGDSSITRSQGGLGIGLKLVKTLTELHGGTVTVESHGMGTGSAFTVRFPKYEGFVPVERRATPRVGKDAFAAQGGPKKILVVDDNTDLVSAFSRLLTIVGYEVVGAHDGVSAIARAKEFHPDVVLLDIGLPGMSGYEIADVLRKELKTPFLLVAISGYGGAQDKMRTREAGFDHHLTKPVSIADIQRILSH